MNRDFSVLIKPVSGACNLRCRYCFYQDEMRQREQGSFGRMSAATLENVVRKFLRDAGDCCTFAFQGGEPTLAGLPFYEELIRLERRYNARNVRIENALQTNGCAMTRELAEFLARHRFLVGLSIDGTPALHDAWRVGASGEGSYERARSAARLFDECGVDYNILTVVNAQTAAHAREIYGSYFGNGWRYWQFIACLDGLAPDAPAQPWSLTPAAYGEFLCALFDLWYADWQKRRQPYIRSFENYIGILLGHPPESCDMRGSCGLQYVVEADGSVYPCDFYALESCRLGNLNTDRLERIDIRRGELRYVERSLPLPEDCRACPWLTLCRNGCYRYRDSNDKNRFCESFRRFFAHTERRMRRIAATLRIQN